MRRIGYSLVMKSAVAIIALLMAFVVGCESDDDSGSQSITLPPETKKQKSANTSKTQIVYYDADSLPDGKQGDRSISYDKFYDVRYDVVKACGEHGTTLPDGTNAAEDPVYFIVDNWYNDWERYQYLEVCKPSGLTRTWLAALMKVLRKHDGWRIGVGGLGDGYAVVFSDKIMVTGDAFRQCNSVDQFMKIASRGLRIQELMEHCDDVAFEELSRIATHRRSLKIGDSRVTDEGLAKLKAFPDLLELELNETEVTDEGLKNLRHVPHLRELRLDGTKITDNGLRSLSVLTDLRDLNLDETSIVGQGLESLSDCESLEELWLQGAKIDDSALAVIAGFPALKVLHISDTAVTDAGVAELKRATNLEELTLLGTRITDDGLRHLVSLDNLQRLDLSRTAVSDAGVVHLRRFKTLRELFLDDTKVTKQGVLMLREELKGTRIAN